MDADKKMRRLTHILCAILLAGSLLAVTPAGAVEEKQVTPEIVWTYQRPMSEMVIGANRWSRLSSVLGLSDGTIVALVLESNLHVPLLFRFDSAGNMLWGVRLDDDTDDMGVLTDQLRPLPSLSTGPSPAGVMVLDTWEVWRVEANGKLRWKRTGDRFDLDLTTSMAVLDDQSVVIGGMEAVTPCRYSYASLVRLDKKGERLWHRWYYLGRNWDFVVQVLPLADGRILGLIQPEGPAAFMGSASNPCRDRSGQQHLVWLDRDGNRLKILALPRGATIERLAELPDGRLAAIVTQWRSYRWSFRTMTSEGATLTERTYGPVDFAGWQDSMDWTLDFRVVPDGLLFAGVFDCTGREYCHGYDVSRFFKLAPNGEVMRVWNTGSQHVFGGSFMSDQKSFIGRSSDSRIIRIQLD